MVERLRSHYPTTKGPTMTNAELLAALTVHTDRQWFTAFDGTEFSITSWEFNCTKCGQIVSHEDSDEWIFQVYDCSCRISDENEALIWAFNAANDDRRQAEFWETEQASLTQAESRWSEGWIA